MNEQREAEWAELEARALRLLEHAKEVEPREVIRRYGSVLRLWHYPAFGPQTTWTILTPGRKVQRDAGPVVREVTWDRAADHERLFNPLEGLRKGFHGHPTLGLREALLPAVELGSLLEAAANLAVPVVLCTRPGVVGLDGEYFGLETYEASSSVRLQWWCDGPTEWRHFTDWFGQVRSFLAQHLDQAG
jgi:hypothetical protein